MAQVRQFKTRYESDGPGEPRRRTDSIEVALDENWTAVYELVPQDGQLVVGELRVFPGKPDAERSGMGSREDRPVPFGGLTARLLRKVRITEPLKFGHDTAVEMEEIATSAGAFQDVALHLEDVKQRSAGRPRLPDIHYAEAAEMYVKALRHEPRKPVVWAAQRMNYSPTRMRDIVSEARRRKLLTPSPRGRPGGQLTPKARELLRNQRGRLEHS